MPLLSCYVDDRTLSSLLAHSQASGRSVEDLAEAAIAEAALQAEAAEPPRRRHPQPRQERA